jgi:hypothetical protein
MVIITNSLKTSRVTATGSTNANAIGSMAANGSETATAT